MSSHRELISSFVTAEVVAGELGVELNEALSELGTARATNLDLVAKLAEQDGQLQVARNCFGDMGLYFPNGSEAQSRKNFKGEAPGKHVHTTLQGRSAHQVARTSRSSRELSWPGAKKGLQARTKLQPTAQTPAQIRGPLVLRMPDRAMSGPITSLTKASKALTQPDILREECTQVKIQLALQHKEVHEAHVQRLDAEDRCLTHESSREQAESECTSLRLQLRGEQEEVCVRRIETDELRRELHELELRTEAQHSCFLDELDVCRQELAQEEHSTQQLRRRARLSEDESAAIVASLEQQVDASTRDVFEATAECSILKMQLEALKRQAAHEAAAVSFEWAAEHEAQTRVTAEFVQHHKQAHIRQKQDASTVEALVGRMSMLEEELRVSSNAKWSLERELSRSVRDANYEFAAASAKWAVERDLWRRELTEQSQKMVHDLFSIASCGRFSIHRDRNECSLADFGCFDSCITTSSISGYGYKRSHM